MVQLRGVQYPDNSPPSHPDNQHLLRSLWWLQGVPWMGSKVSCLIEDSKWGYKVNTLGWQLYVSFDEHFQRHMTQCHQYSMSLEWKTQNTGMIQRYFYLHQLDWKDQDSQNPMRTYGSWTGRILSIWRLKSLIRTLNRQNIRYQQLQKSKGL